MSIVEGVASMWHYHLARNGKTRALCGERTMATSIPLARWQVPFGEHFPKRPTWCAECDRLRKLEQP